MLPKRTVSPSHSVCSYPDYTETNPLKSELNRIKHAHLIVFGGQQVCFQNKAQIPGDNRGWWAASPWRVGILFAIWETAGRAGGGGGGGGASPDGLDRSGTSTLRSQFGQRLDYLTPGRTAANHWGLSPQPGVRFCSENEQIRNYATVWPFSQSTKHVGK